jgi:hypothetical protein
LSIKGTITVNEDIVGDVSAVAEPTRCSLDMKTCQKLSPFKFGELCKKIIDKNSFCYNTWKNISPPFRCPLKPGNYTVPETSIDLSMFSMLSIDGYVFVIRVKFFVNGGNNVKRTLMCVNTESTFTKVRVRN